MSNRKCKYVGDCGTCSACRSVGLTATAEGGVRASGPNTAGDRAANSAAGAHLLRRSGSRSSSNGTAR